MILLRGGFLSAGGNSRGGVIGMANVNGFGDDVADLTVLGLGVECLGLTVDGGGFFDGLDFGFGIGDSGGSGLPLVLGRRSGCGILLLDAVQSLAGAAAEAAEHGLAAVLFLGLVGGDLRLFDLVGGRRVDGSGFCGGRLSEHGLLDLGDGGFGDDRGLTGLLSGGGSNGRLLLLLRFLHWGRWADAAVALDESGEETRLLLVGRNGFFLGRLSLGLFRGDLHDRESSFGARLSGGCLGNLRWVLGDRLILGRNIRFEFSILLLLLLDRALDTTPARNLAEDAVALLGLLFGLDGRGLDWLLLVVGLRETSAQCFRTTHRNNLPFAEWSASIATPTTLPPPMTTPASSAL